MQVIDDVRFAQLCVLNGFLERKSLGVEGNEAVADGPTFDGVLKMVQWEENVISES